MKIIKYLFPLLALPFFSSLSCGKDPSAEKPLLKLDEDFLSYVSFPKGSYWIYRERGTGETDSAYFFERTERIDIERHERYERIAQHEIIRKDTIFGNASPYYISETRTRYDYLHISNIENTMVGWTIFSKFNDISYDSAATFLTNPQIIPHDSLVVNNQKYENIIECYYEAPIYAVPYKRVYFAKDIGVIKREYWDGTIWELVRYHHEQ